MVVSPVQTSDGSVVAHTRFLAPAFGAERVKLLGMPIQNELNIVTYGEHWNPYSILYNVTAFNNPALTKVMVDEEMRDFILEQR